MRRLKYYLACSIDGFIAHEDGSFDGFLADMKSEAVADFLKSYEWFDTVLMGRKTYEIGLKQGVTDPYPKMKTYVFSRTMNASPNKRVELVSENAGVLVRQLKNGTGKDIWLCGGADLAATLFVENLIDDIILKVNPSLMGSGIPLFSGRIKQTALELTGSKIYSDGLVLLHYRVKK
jgi:dihydrofolate reductase